MDITVKIKRVEPIENVTEKFKKRRIIVDYEKNPNYPNVLEFTLTQKNVNLADALNPGDEVKLFYDLKGKEFVDKTGVTRVFNTLEVWRLEVAKKSIDYIEPVSSVSKEEDDGEMPF